MAHIAYGGRSYPFPDGDIEQMRQVIMTQLLTGQPGELNIGSERDGVEAYIYVSPGVPIAVHSWDPDEGGLK